MAEVKNIQYKSRLQGISIPVEPRGFVGSIMLNAVADGFNSVAIGLNTAKENQAEESVAIGTNVCTQLQPRHSVAIGRDCVVNSSAQQSVAIGSGVTCLGPQGVAIGGGNLVNADVINSVAIGYGAMVHQSYTIGIPEEFNRGGPVSGSAGSIVVQTGLDNNSNPVYHRIPLYPL